MNAQKLMNRWCDLELQIIELFRDANSALRTTDKTSPQHNNEYRSLQYVRSTCFEVLKIINNRQ